MHAGLERQRCVRVSEVVQPNRCQTEPSRAPLEIAAHRVGVPHRPELVGEDKIAWVRPCFTRVASSMLLSAPMRPQQRHRVWVEVHDAPAACGLRFAEDDPTLDRRHRVHHRQPFAFQVQINPTQAENLASDTVPARDAGSTGATSGGWEVWIPWSEFYPDGIPTTGLSIGVVAVMANIDGTYASNQALPSLDSADEPGTDAVALSSAVLLQVDATGTPIGVATVVP